MIIEKKFENFFTLNWLNEMAKEGERGMTLHIVITDQEVTYLLKALKERQENAKGKMERLSLANIRDLIEGQTGRRKSDDVGLHYQEELDKQQREKKGKTAP